MATSECCLECNLDCMEPEDLMRVAKVFNILSAYAKAKAKAIQDRLAGEIECALAQEKFCDALYERLPAWAAW